MKYILTLFTIFQLLSGIGQNSEVIMYTNIIHPNGYYQFEINKYDKTDEVLKLYTDSLKRYSIPISKHHELIETILNQLKSGKVQAFVADLNTPHLHPEDFFKTPIPKEYFNTNLVDQLPDQNLVEKLYYVEEYPKYDEEFFEPMVDEETGDYLYERFIDPYISFDYTSFTFFEKWTYQDDSLTKNVIGYTLNVNKLNPETGNIEGIKPLFFIYNQTSSDEELLVENIHTLTDIYKDKDKNDVDWWTNQLSLPFKQKITESLLNSTSKLFSPIPPYDAMSGDQVESKMHFLDQFELMDEYGDVMYNPTTGEVMLYTDSIPVNYQDIDRIEFIEDWLFNPQTLSIRKKIKGIIPHKTYESEEKDLPFFRLKTEGMFLIKFDEINTSINNVHIYNIRAKRHLFPDVSDSVIQELKLFPIWHHQLDIPTSVSEKIKTDYFKASVSDNTFYSWNWYQNKFEEIAPQKRDSLNSISFYVPKFDQYGEVMYDELTGDLIEEIMVTPYTNKDIASLQLIENWHYNYLKNQFTIEITHQGVEIVNTNNDMGKIMGLTPLMYSHSTSSKEWTLIQENIEFYYRFFESTENSFQSYNEYTHLIYPHEQEQLIHGMLDNVKQKKAKAINCLTGKPIKKKEIASHLGSVNYTNYPAISFTEDLFYNPTSFNFKKEVKSITLYRLTNEGDLKKETPWITIQMNKD